MTNGRIRREDAHLRREIHGGGIEQVGGHSRQARPSHHRLRRPPHRGDAGALRLHPRRGRRPSAGKVPGDHRAALDAHLGRGAARRTGHRQHLVAGPHQERPRPRHRHDPTPPRRAPRRAGPRLLRPLSLGRPDLPAVERRGGAARQLPGLQPVRRRYLRPLRVADDPGGGGPHAHAGGGHRGDGVRRPRARPQGRHDRGPRPPAPRQGAVAASRHRGGVRLVVRRLRRRQRLRLRPGLGQGD